MYPKNHQQNQWVGWGEEHLPKVKASKGYPGWQIHIYSGSKIRIYKRSSGGVPQYMKPLGCLQG